MDPSVGERLGFGITLVLTVYFIQVGTSDMLPVCGEFTWLDVFNVVQLVYTVTALIDADPYPTPTPTPTPTPNPNPVLALIDPHP